MKIILALLLLAAPSWAARISVSKTVNVPKLVIELASVDIYPINDGVHTPNADLNYDPPTATSTGTLVLRIFSSVGELPSSTVSYSSTTVSTTTATNTITSHTP